MVTGKNTLEIPHQQLSILLEQAVGLVKTYWETLEDRSAYPVTSGKLTTDLFARSWRDEGCGRDVLKSFKTIADHSRPSNGKFFGYVFGSGEPVGALSELLIAALNQNVTSWRGAPAAAAIEHTVVGWLADAVGCAGFRGSLCGGGSTGNLMGLAMAREAKLPANKQGARPCVVYCSEEAHFSVSKAVALLGIGQSNLRMIATDEHFRMRTDALRQAIADDSQAGRSPIAIVATAGTVICGAIDPIPEIAEIARSENLWLHVDGAYGALAALAAPEKFKGLAQADSVSLDAHKWLYQTVDCSCLIYREQTAARAAFSYSADYARSFSEDPTESFLFFQEAIEQSRRFRALKLWMSLQYHGRDAYRQAIAQDLHHAALLAHAVKAHPELELLAPVALSAVCFRHRTKDNEAILRRVIARGRVYLSNATIGGEFALRACFVNHRTTEETVRSIVEEVVAAGGELNQ